MNSFVLFHVQLQIEFFLVLLNDGFFKSKPVINTKKD